MQHTSTTIKEIPPHLQTLEQTLMKIYFSSSQKALLSVIKKDLPKMLELDSITLSDTPPSQKALKKIYSYSFEYKNNPHFIFFHKKQKTKALVLKKIGHALESMFIHLENKKNLTLEKQQWQMAFDVIAIPLCLTTTTGKILKTNKSFRDKTKKSEKQLIKKNYFFEFFGKPNNNPLPITNHCFREKTFIQGQEHTFEINQTGINIPVTFEPFAAYKQTSRLKNLNKSNESVQKIFEQRQKKIQLVILRNITEQVKVENNLALSAPKDELNIISSSIAHELNNSIAGVSALLQTALNQKADNNIITQDLKKMLLTIRNLSLTIDQVLSQNRSG